MYFVVGVMRDWKLQLRDLHFSQRERERKGHETEVFDDHQNSQTVSNGCDGDSRISVVGLGIFKDMQSMLLKRLARR